MSSAVHLATNGSNLISESTTTLDRVVINSPGLRSSATVHAGIDDTGPVIAVIDTTVAGDLEYDLALSALTVVTAGDDPADLTVITN